MWIGIRSWIERLVSSHPGLSVVVGLALLVPGGSLMLLLLWALEHRPWFTTWESVANRRRQRALQ